MYHRGVRRKINPLALIQKLKGRNGAVYLSNLTECVFAFNPITGQSGQATTGPRATIQREPSWLTWSWMWFGRRPRAVTACRRVPADPLTGWGYWLRNGHLAQQDP